LVSAWAEWRRLRKSPGGWAFFVMREQCSAFQYWV
jgi:hypothetical protein